MSLDEVMVTKAIVEGYLESFLENTEVEAALVGAGPANLVAAKCLAEANIKTVLFEKRLSVGGGLWGGGMMFPRIVVQQAATRILEEYGIRYHEHFKGYYVANSIETVAKLTAGSNGALDVAAAEKTVATLLAGGSDPVITAAPTGAWTSVITDKALAE